MTTYNNYAGTGATTDFAVTFAYLNTDDIEVYVDGVLQVYTTDYTLQITPSVEVQFVVAPASGADIWIIRNSDVSNPINSYVNPATLNDEDLNRHLLQNLYLHQEGRELIDFCALGKSVTPVTQVMAPGVWAKLINWDAAGDSRIAFGDLANDRLLIARGGLYRLSWSLTWNWSTGADIFYVSPYKNGAELDANFRKPVKSDEGTFARLSGSALIPLSAGDYIEMWGMESAGTNFDFQGGMLEVARVGDI